MKKEWAIAFIVAIVASIVIMFLTIHRKNLRLIEENAKLKNDNDVLRNNYFDLLEKYLQETGNASPEMIGELQRLKASIDTLDVALHVELESVIRHVCEGEGTKAIRDLAKIVENVLKEKAKNDTTFTKKPMLHNLLEYARSCRLISPLQFENGLKLKQIRNEESHELAVVKEPREIFMSLYAGIDILYALK